MPESAFHPEVRALIGRLGLAPLPVEGTLFAATYRGPGQSAMIGLYCEEPRSVSLFHRLPVDEVWHFYGGDPLRLILLLPDGSSQDVILGPDTEQGHLCQCVVPAGVWQAGHLAPGGRYALYGCTVAPAFAPEMFEGGERARLLAQYPDRAADIAALGCSSEQLRMPAR